VKGQPWDSRQEKVFANQIADKVIIATVYKELLQLNNTSIDANAWEVYKFPSSLGNRQLRPQQDSSP
jgi:hypothetical protein